MEHLNGTAFEASPAPETTTTTNGVSASTSAPTTSAMAQKTQIPISQLSPNLSNPSTSYIRAIITLIWPYSSVAKSLSVLLAEPDFRLRNNRGQAKVYFTENVGKRVEESKLGSGDELILSLEGAEFTTLDDNRDPRNVGYELRYGTKCVVQIRRAEGGEIVLLEIAAQEQQELDTETAAVQELQQAELAITGAKERFRDEPRASPPPSTAFNRSMDGRIKAVQNEDGEWSSPAFIKRARLSYGSLISDELSSFLGDEEDKGHKNKRRRFEPRKSGTWRYMSESRSPSPEPAQAQEAVEDEVMAEVAPSAPAPELVVEKSRYTTMEIGVQTDDLSFDDVQLEMFRRSTAIGREVRTSQQEPIHMVEEGVQTFGDAVFSPIAFQSPSISERASQTPFGVPAQPSLFAQASTTPFGQPPAKPLFGQRSHTLSKPLFSQPSTTPFGQPSQPSTTPFGEPSQLSTTPFDQPPQQQASTTPLGEPPAHSTVTSPLASKSKHATPRVATPSGQWPVSMWTDMGYLRPPPVESPTASQFGTSKSHESTQKEKEKESESKEVQIPPSPSQTDASAEDAEGKNTHMEDRDEDDGHDTAAAALEVMSRLQPSTTLPPHHRGTVSGEYLEMDRGIPVGDVLGGNLNEVEDKLTVAEKIRSSSPPDTERASSSPVPERGESMYPDLSSPVRQSSETTREKSLRQMREGSVESMDLSGDFESECDDGAQQGDEGMPDDSESEEILEEEYSEEEPEVGEIAEESSEPEDFRRLFNELREQVLEEGGREVEIEHDKGKLADAQMWRDQLGSQPQAKSAEMVESEDDEDEYSGSNIEGEDEGEDAEGEEEDGEEVPNFGDRCMLLNPRAQQWQPRRSPFEGPEEGESQGEEQESFPDDEVDGDADAEGYSDDDAENEVEYGSNDGMEGQRYGNPGELHADDQEDDYDDDEFSQEEDGDLDKHTRGYGEADGHGPIDGRGYMQPPRAHPQAPPKQSAPVFIDLLSDSEDEVPDPVPAKEASAPRQELDVEAEAEAEGESGEDECSGSQQASDKGAGEFSDSEADIMTERHMPPIPSERQAIEQAFEREQKQMRRVSEQEISGYEAEDGTTFEDEGTVIPQYDGAGDSKPVQHFRVPSEQHESVLPEKVESVEPPAAESGEEADVEDSGPVPVGDSDPVQLQPQGSQATQESEEAGQAAEHIQLVVQEAQKEAKQADVTERQLERNVDHAVNSELAESKDEELNEEAEHDIEMAEISDVRLSASPVPTDAGSVDEVVLPLPETPLIEEDGGEAIDLSRSESHPGLGDHSHDEEEEVGEEIGQEEEDVDMHDRISEPETEYGDQPPNEIEQIGTMVEDNPSEVDTEAVSKVVIPEDGAEIVVTSDVVNEEQDEDDDGEDEEDDEDGPSTQLFRESIAHYSQESTQVVETSMAMFDESENVVRTEALNEKQQTIVSSVFSQVVEEATSFQILSATQPPQFPQSPPPPRSPQTQKEAEADALGHMAEVANKREFETPEFEEPTASQAVQPTTFHTSLKPKTLAKNRSASPDLGEHAAKHTRSHDKDQPKLGNEHGGTDVPSIDVDDIDMQNHPAKHTRAHDHDSDLNEINYKKFSAVSAWSGSPAAHTRSHDTEEHCVEDDEAESAKGLPPSRRASSSRRSSEPLFNLREKTSPKEKEKTPVVEVPVSSSIENMLPTPSPPKRVTRSRRGTQERDAANPAKAEKAKRRLTAVVEVPVTSSIENVTETPTKPVTRGRKASVSNTAKRAVTPVVEVPASSIEQASPPAGGRVTRSRKMSASQDPKPITPKRRTRAMSLRSDTASSGQAEVSKADQSIVLEPLQEEAEEEDEDSQSVIDPGAELLLLHEGSLSPEERATPQPAPPTTRSLSNTEVTNESLELESSGSLLEVTPVKRVTGLQHNLRSKPDVAATPAKLQLRDPGADALLSSSPAQQPPATPAAEATRAQGHAFATPSTAPGAPSVPGTPDFKRMTPSAVKASITRHLRTSLSTYTPLKGIKPLLGKKIDVLCLCTSAPATPVRAKHGPRHWVLKFGVTDPASIPGVTEVQVFRPYKDALPDINIGDVLLLRHFLVKAEAGWGLRSEDASSWAVWKGEKDGSEDIAGGVVECKGPPVEYGNGEEEHVKVLKEWWRGLDNGVVERMSQHGKQADKQKSSARK